MMHADCQNYGFDCCMRAPFDFACSDDTCVYMHVRGICQLRSRDFKNGAMRSAWVHGGLCERHLISKAISKLMTVL